jgi:hypothetical protein
MPRLGSVSAALLLACLAVGRAADAVPRASHCREGILRWTDDGSEVALFGVNYYAPFSIDYAGLTRRGVDLEEALRHDLAHLRRLGLDALRLHCWDREISDPDGNLVDNDHLRLLDLLIAEAGKQGLYLVLTPIAWWGAADPRTNGFSNRFTMQQMTTLAEALDCQTRYLAQFVAHTNPFTGLRYADDPRIVAFETINEPIYPAGTTDEAVIGYIDAQVAAIRGAGCGKPVLYNCWGGREEAAAASTLDGVTFGWYPTGLASGQALSHDCLPTADRHHSAHTPCLERMLKAVYEFDAADVQGSYMYPAMAREFRSAGIQVATQFQYDAMVLAGTNENWQTHHLSLPYTPGKAISFAIAAEAFRRVPRLTPFPKYPGNVRFADVRISFEQDLSELVTETDFLHSNTTQTVPPAPAGLRRIWGVGSSPVVAWPGTGAYFLDRLAEGIWRLQVYPDAVVIADPYAGGNTEKVRLISATHPLRLSLPDLGSEFLCRPEADEAAAVRAREGMVTLGPGSYLLRRDDGVVAAVPAGVPFILPPPLPGPLTPGVRLEVPDLWREGRPLPIGVTVAASSVVGCTARFLIPGESTSRTLPLSLTGAYRYQAEAPLEWVVAGTARCVVDVVLPEGTFRFPGGGPPRDPAPAAPHCLWRVAGAAELPKIEGGGWLRGQPVASHVAGPEPDSRALRLEADGFGQAPACVGVRLPAAPPAPAAEHSTLAVTVRGGPLTSQVEVSLVQDDGSAYGTQVPVSPDWRTVRIPLGTLRPMWSTQGGHLAAARLSQVALIFGAWLFPDVRDGAHWIGVADITLLQEPAGLPIRIRSAHAPVLLVRPAAQYVRPHGQDAAATRAPGPAEDMEAVRVSVKGFGPSPDCTSFRLGVLPGELEALDRLGQDAAIILRLRAGMPDTDTVEIVFLEEDGSPWGAVVPLRRGWSEQALTPADLRFFGHWAHPEGRGGPDDVLQVSRVRHVNVCFGAWLYGERASRPHAVEVSEISVGAAP